MARNGRNRRSDAALIVGLASGRTVTEAAEAAGISVRTAHRRLDDEDFCRRVTEARADMFRRALGLLADGATSAVQTLRDLAAGANSETVKLGAAKAILDASHRWRDAAEFDERLSVVERRLDEWQSSEATGESGAGTCRRSAR